MRACVRDPVSANGCNIPREARLQWFSRPTACRVLNLDADSRHDPGMLDRNLPDGCAPLRSLAARVVLSDSKRGGEICNVRGGGGGEEEERRRKSWDIGSESRPPPA